MNILRHHNIWNQLKALTQKKILINSVSNYFSFVWIGLVSIISIPIYVKILGINSWGIIAACSSLQLLFSFIDAGFSQIVPRWAARESENHESLRYYIRLFHKTYVLLGLIGFFSIQLGAHFLAYSWFKVTSGRAFELEFAIRIISFQMLFQFVNNLNIGLWYGLQEQLSANIRLTIFATLKHLSAITCLILFGPRTAIYALSFAIVALVEFSVNTMKVNENFQPYTNIIQPSGASYNKFLIEVSNLSFGIVIGLFASQLDRIVLSRTLSIDKFGIYVAVSNLSLAFLQLQSPITRAYFPMLVNDFRDRGYFSRSHIKNLFKYVFFLATMPILISCLFADKLIGRWIKNPEFSALGVGPFRVLMIAVALNTIYGVIYQIIVASGKTGFIIIINGFSLTASLVFLFFSGTSSGLYLGGYIWLISSFTQLVIGIFWYFKIQNKSWG